MDVSEEAHQAILALSVHKARNDMLTPYRSPYEVLGVTYRATRAEINQAYRKLVKRYHPDLNKTIDRE